MYCPNIVAVVICFVARNFNFLHRPSEVMQIRYIIQELRLQNFLINAVFLDVPISANQGKEIRLQSSKGKIVLPNSPFHVDCLR